MPVSTLITTINTNGHVRGRRSAPLKSNFIRRQVGSGQDDRKRLQPIYDQFLRHDPVRGAVEIALPGDHGRIAGHRDDRWIVALKCRGRNGETCSWPALCGRAVAGEVLGDNSCWWWYAWRCGLVEFPCEIGTAQTVGSSSHVLDIPVSLGQQDPVLWPSWSGAGWRHLLSVRADNSGIEMEP